MNKQAAHTNTIYYYNHHFKFNNQLTSREQKAL